MIARNDFQIQNLKHLRVGSEVEWGESQNGNVIPLSK